MSDRVVYCVPFRLSPLSGAISFCGCVAGACLMFYFVINPPTMPVRVRGMTFSPTQAWWIFAALAAISPVSVMMLGKGLYDSLFNPSQIVVTDHAVVLPDTNWRGYCQGDGYIEVPLDDVISVDVGKFAGFTRQLKITHTGGRAIVLSNMLPSRQSFDQLAQAIGSRAG